MTDRIARIIVIAALAGRTLLGTAHAQSAEAETLFGEGDKLMTVGKVAQACEAFDASNRIEPRAGTLIRLGQCREQNHQLASAWSAYKDALARAKDPNKRQIAAARIEAIEARLSYLTVAVTDDSRIDGLAITRNGKPLDPALWNRPIPIDGGDYEIGGKAAGHQAWKTRVTVPVEAAKVSVEVPKLELRIRATDAPKREPQVTPADPPKREPQVTPVDPPKREPQVTPADPPKREPQVTPADPPRSMPMAPVVSGDATTSPDESSSGGGLTGRRKVALGVAGVGGLAIAAGVMFGLQAKSREDDAHALCPQPSGCMRAVQANALIQEGRSKALLANVSYGVGAAAVIGAAVLWFTGGSPAQPSTVSVVPHLVGATGVDVTVRF